MGITYQCHVENGMDPGEWNGMIKVLNENGMIETEVTARGSSFHMLVGKHSYGNFICIPNWGIGTELSSLSDRFWNAGQLSETYPGISQTDIISITEALAALAEYIEL